MEFEVVRGSSLGFYARKNAIPTMTLNDVKDVITGFKDNSLHRQTRSIVSTFGGSKIFQESPSNPGLFLTPAAEKTKTQEKNSCQKLKEKS